MNKKERGRRNRRRIIAKAVIKIIVGVLLIQLMPIIMFISIINDNFCATEENTYSVSGYVDDAWVRELGAGKHSNRFIYFEIDGIRYKFNEISIEGSFEEIAEMLKHEGKVDIIVKKGYDFWLPLSVVDIRSDDKVYADIEEYNASAAEYRVVTKIALPFVWLIATFISLLHVWIKWDVIKAHLVKKKKNKKPLE